MSATLQQTSCHGTQSDHITFNHIDIANKLTSKQIHSFVAVALYIFKITSSPVEHVVPKR